MKQLTLASAIVLSAISTVVAQNPIITHIFTADPSARVHEGKLFVYPSGDKVPDEGHVFVDQTAGFCMPGYHVFSLEGGSTWHDYGWVLKENEVPWGVKDMGAMWAPDCIEKDGKYYYYYPAKAVVDIDNNKWRRIGVGVGDNPQGPFKWEENYMQGINKEIAGIDPGILVDDDNQAYMFLRSGDGIGVAPLTDDMTGVKEDVITVQGLPYGYKEGPFPFKIEDTYYLSFAHRFPGEEYNIGYATSKTPMGPYEYRGTLMDSIGKDTNHNSVVFYDGRWILFYHSWQLSGHNKLRSICADYMTLNEDGSFEKTTPTLRGIGSPRPGEKIEIDRYNTINGAQVAFVTGGEPTGWMVCETQPDSYVTFNEVDFVDGSSTTMEARIASCGREGTIEVRENDPEGAIIASFDVKHTGGWDSWITVQSEITTPLEGKHDICVVFKCVDSSFSIANLNWLQLVPAK
ncbi:MAG: family 43 glycosylhydrolase [Rikenellaceae bacterium]